MTTKGLLRREYERYIHMLSDMVARPYWGSHCFHKRYEEWRAICHKLAEIDREKKGQ